MMRTLLIAIAPLLLVSSAFAGTNQYGWTLSGSATDAFVNEGAPVAGVTTVYLWYACNTGDGAAAFEAGLNVVPVAATFGGVFVQIAPTDPSDIFLVISGCPSAPILAGSLLFLDDGTGLDICLQPSSNGLNVTVDCENAMAWDNDFIGYSSTGNPPCRSGTFCDAPVSVDDGTWGGVKGLYR